MAHHAEHIETVVIPLTIIPPPVLCATNLIPCSRHRSLNPFPRHTFTTNRVYTLSPAHPHRSSLDLVAVAVSVSYHPHLVLHGCTRPRSRHHHRTRTLNMKKSRVRPHQYPSPPQSPSTGVVNPPLFRIETPAERPRNWH